MNTYVISSSGELDAAIGQAQSGDRIELRGGSYGDFYLRNKDFGEGIEITAHDRSSPPVFNSVKLNKVSNLTFEGVNIDFTPNADTVEWDCAFRADRSSNITVANSVVTGGVSVSGVHPDSEAGAQGAKGILGEPIGTGFNFLWSENIAIKDTEISEFSSGIRTTQVNGLTVSNVDIHDVRRVPVGGADTDNVLIESSHFHDIKPWKFSAAGDHGDHVHFWTTPENDGPNHNYVIRNNFFEQGEGKAILGIYLDDNRNNVGFRDILIEGNVIHNSNTRSILFEDVADAVIRNNTLLQKDGDPTEAPQIYLADGSHDILIENNILSGITGPVAHDLLGHDIRLVNNVPVQIHSPFEEGYASALLRDPFATSPTFADLTALPLGSAHGAGPIALTDTPWIRSVSRLGLETGAFSFNVIDSALDAQLSLNATTERNASISGVEWNFGDGTIARGQSVEHIFASAGSYVVNARISYDDGSVENIHQTVRAFTPIALDTDFSSGFEDHSDIINQITTFGDVELVSSGRGTSARMTSNKAVINFQQGVELEKNRSFTISFGFKSPDDINDWGRALHFSSVAVIDIRNDFIKLQARSNENEKFNIISRSLSIDDQSWHHLTYTFDAEAGLANLFLDGQDIGEISGIAGEFEPNSSHPLSLGNPYGSGFKGLIDDLLFIRSNVNSDKALEIYENFVAQGDVKDIFKNIGVENDRFEGNFVEGELHHEDIARDNPSKQDSFDDDLIEENLGRDKSTEKGLSKDEAVNEDKPGGRFASETPSFSYEGAIVLEAGRTHTVDKDFVKDLLIGASNFNISFNLDPISPGETGEILRYGTSFIVQVMNGEVVIRAETENGQMMKFMTKGAGLDMMGMRSVNVSLVSGLLAASVDGTTLGAIEMPSPIAVNGWDGHDLYFGNPWSNDSYEATLSNFCIVENLLSSGSREPVVENLQAAFQTLTPAGEAGLRIFDARHSTLDDAGLPEDASYAWTFADGATAKGSVVARSYDGNLTEDVHLEVILPDGQTSQTSQTVEIFGSELVDYMAGGDFVLSDGSSIDDDDLTASGLDLGASGVVLEVGNQYIRDLVGADEFNFYFGLRSDDNDSHGEVFRFGTSLVVRVTDNGQLAFNANTGAGRVQLRTPEVDLSDMLAHDVEIAFKDERLGIYVDGTLEAETDMASGLSGTGSHGIYFGNPWGRDNFEGVIDAFELTREQSDFERDEIFELTGAELDLFS